MCLHIIKVALDFMFAEISIHDVYTPTKEANCFSPQMFLSKYVHRYKVMIEC